jgi:hypothetical protein
MMLRDHSQPCEHGKRVSHDHMISALEHLQFCPGGREITIDYEAAGEALLADLKRRAEALGSIVDPAPETVAFWQLNPIDAAKIVLDAALGVPDER